jgi:Skp family chaperone for outer membrane proteins
MLKVKFAAGAALTIATLAFAANAQQPAAAAQGPIPDGKVAVINTQVFAGQIAELKQKYEQVDAQFKERYDRLRQIEADLKNLETEMRTKGDSWSPEVRQQKQDEYDRKKKLGTRDYEDLKADYDKTVETATKPVRDKLFQFLEKYAGQRGIVMVFNLAGAAQTGSLAFWHPGADVTDDFCAEYNKANPVATASAPSQPAANRPATRPPVKP